MLKKDRDRLASEGSLRATLKDKSRRRRAALARAAPAVAGQAALRNDLAPALEMVSIPLNALRSSARRLRKSDLGHVREVANSIGALGFCAPLLISKDKLVLDGEARHRRTLEGHRANLRTPEECANYFEAAGYGFT